MKASHCPPYCVRAIKTSNNTHLRAATGRAAARAETTAQRGAAVDGPDADDADDDATVFCGGDSEKKIQTGKGEFVIFFLRI